MKLIAMRINKFMDKVHEACLKVDELDEPISELQKLYDELYDNIRLPDNQDVSEMVKGLPIKIKEMLEQTQKLIFQAQLNLIHIHQFLTVLMLAHSELNEKKVR